MKKSFTWAFLCVFLSLLASCNLGVGLGDELDLEAPVISITSLESGGTTVTSFGGGVYCHKSVTFTGTATDNHSVSSVYVQKKYSSESDYSTLKNASLSGSIWTINLDLPDEGVCFLKFVATDAADNSSTKSSKVVTLFIDESAPVASAWYIDRNLSGITYSLKDKETLESLDLTLPENKDAAQNVSFSIKATATDTMGIDKITLKVCDEDGNQICEVENSSENQYAPEFEITHELLVAGDESLASGKHYLQIKYDASDIVTVPAANTAENVEVDAGYFIWWPESDNPRITQASIATEDDGSEYLNIAVDSVISLDIFDDDQLAQSYCALLTDDEYSAFGTPDWAAIQENPGVLESAVAEDAREKRFNHFEGSSGQRETTVTLTTASTSQTMHLLAFAVDGTSAAKTVTKNITVYVSDSNSPLLIISSPKNNSVPAVAMSSDGSSADVKIEGQSLDINGCDYLEFVWVSDSVEDKSAAAKTWLNAISTSTQHDAYAPASGENQKVSEKDGMKLWSVSLGSASTSGSFKKQNFSFTVDLLKDFVNSSGENEKAKEKFFVAKISRADGKYSYSQYKLAADTDAPTITSISPSQDMQIVESTSDYLIEFSASKSSGLAIDTDAYAITVSDNACSLTNPHYDSSSGTYKATISESQLIEMMNSSLKPRFIFSAADIFGNKAEASYTIVISNLPQLKSISSGNSGTAKLGDEILINASFSSAVSVDEISTPYLKLKGITNSSKSVTTDTIVQANYKSGSGSTTLVFSYTVQAGDSSDKLLVYNETDSSGNVVGPINANGAASLSTDNVHLTTLTDANNLQAKKTIKIDGIAPNVSSVSITSDAESGNKVNGIDYLREGKTITAKVTVDDSVYIQGRPAFVVTSGSGTISLPYQSASGTTITFSKKIESTDANGEVSYVPSSCISDFATIVDSAGNSLVLQSDSSSTAAKITVDTLSPSKPAVTITNANSLSKNSSGVYYAGKDTPIKFTLSTESGTTAQYSTDGGSTWTDYSSEVSITNGGSFKITGKLTDYAGNVSDYADEIQAEKASSFPSYSVEITNPDGNYKAGSTLTFKVSFDSNVNVAANAAAKITITANEKGSTSGSGTIGTSKNTATLSSSSEQTNVSSVEFTYTVQDPDEFSPGVAVDAVDLSGITDLYGDSPSSDKVLSAVYARSGIVCDGVAPKVKTMTPSGETSSGSNIYSSGKNITLEFTEPVNRAGGNITIRRVKNWALPPVLTASEFSAVTNALSSDEKNVLSIQENGIDMEDSESLYQANVGTANIYYHGAGQFVGPYKKSTQGITLSSGNYIPDVSTKYVLDFDMGIWETDTVHYYGKTFRTTGTSTTKVSLENGAFATTSTGESVVPKTGSDLSYQRTADDLRKVFEAAHYHERVLDVTSSYITFSSDRKTVTVNFPEGLVGDDDLPNGIEWEVVIDKGAFMDDTGNYFGANASGDIESSDARQKTGGTQAEISSSDSWKRGRISTSSSETPVVLIQTSNGKDSFLSSGVATPVIRVDRYSYGFGTYQVDSSGNKISSYISSDKTEPTGYVRVRIDCQTENAAITYGSTLKEAGESDATTSYPSAADCGGYTSSAATISSLPSAGTSYTNGSIFAGGNGNYKKSCKQIFAAQATANGQTSATGSEGVFQTVVQFYAPYGDTGQCGAQATDRNHFSIRGTTSWAGEPYISPFPLRDSQIGSPYLKRCYRADVIYPNGTPNLTATKTKTITNSGWQSTQLFSASDLSNVNGIKFSVTTSVNGNYGIKGSSSSNTKYWVNSGSSAPTEATLSSTIVNEAKTNGLYLEGQGTFTVTIYCYDKTFDDAIYDYYWLSYEILVNSSFSGYSWHNGGYYDWSKSWGWMIPGEYSKAVKMKNWG